MFAVNDNEKNNNKNEEYNITNEISNISSDNNTTETTELEKGTSAKVDEIALQAKQDADSMNELIKNEAVSFIKNNRKNFYKDSETMEQAMYYGYLLEYAFRDSDKDLARLGQDVYQAVKYVYRGVENVEQESTQENLKQIEEDLQRIN